ncbi:MAG: carbohydrate ABC transporter permease [Chloroflexi bacterium]|nr:MAG: carbohydrate ABC transporter permease [Chloroflexota bacterium]
MTLGEVNSGAFWPKSLNLDNCILFSTDTYLDPDTGETVTKTRLTIDISEAAAEGQGIIPTSNRTISREEHFRIPFPVNYCAAWNNANLGRYIWNTVRIVAITLTGLMIFSPLAAYAFARMEFPGRNLLFGIMLATLMVPEMVQNLPNFLIITELGELMGTKGWGLCNLENCWYNNWPALTIPFMATPFAIFLMRQQFATIPNELWDAARMDGAGHLRFLIQVVLPLSKPVLLVVILFAFIGAWNALAWPILVTTGDTWRPISYGLQEFLDQEGNFAHLRMAGAVITALPVLILYAFTQRYFVEGLSTSGLKG